MTRVSPILAVVGLAVALAGCNETGGGAGPVVSAPIGPAAYKLPPNAGCTGEINQFQGILKADLETGNVERKVFDDIQRDLTRAAGACEAGRGGEAHAIVAASKARHGYRG